MRKNTIQNNKEEASESNTISKSKAKQREVKDVMIMIKYLMNLC
jgi:hypothetical protein